MPIAMEETSYPGQGAFADLRILGVYKTDTIKMYAESMGYLQQLDMGNTEEARAILRRTAEIFGLTLQTTGKEMRTKEAFVRAAVEILSGGKVVIPDDPTFPDLLHPDAANISTTITVPSLTPGKAYWLSAASGIKNNIPVVSYSVQKKVNNPPQVKIWFYPKGSKGLDDTAMQTMDRLLSVQTITAQNPIDKNLRHREIKPDSLTAKEILRLPLFVAK